MAGNFSAVVDAWATETENRLTNIFKQSAQDLIRLMQTPVAKGGNMPVDTGFLRSSLRVTIGGPASGMMERPSGYNLPSGEDISYQVTILGAPIGSSIFAVYIANYAIIQEYGTSTMPGRMFRTLAVQKWQDIVSANVAKAKARF